MNTNLIHSMLEQNSRKQDYFALAKQVASTNSNLNITELILERDLQEIRADLNSTSVDYYHSLRELKDTLVNKSRVAFFSLLGSDLRGVKVNTIIIYDTVELNIGSVYNRVTGKFTAPSEGLYLFHVSTGANDNTQASVQLVLNGNVKNIRWADSASHSDRTFVTTVTPLILRKNDIVYTKIGVAGSAQYIESDIYMRTSFSGEEIN
ncbi:unnamed protein product [Mytilus coruscus]|uniref:C1q domain-containing protein n=1 Tax=Mytilus coruscus TaxID=42192 RepID=A0A6J8CYN2_MYTCO|nr:unnamed protein product [Mytilus coruscus]